METAREIYNELGVAEAERNHAVEKYGNLKDEIGRYAEMFHEMDVKINAIRDRYLAAKKSEEGVA